MRCHSTVEYGSFLWVVESEGLANPFIDWVVDDLEMGLFDVVVCGNVGT